MSKQDIANEFLLGKKRSATNNIPLNIKCSINNKNKSIPVFIFIVTLLLTTINSTSTY